MNSVFLEVLVYLYNIMCVFVSETVKMLMKDFNKMLYLVLKETKFVSNMEYYY